VRVIITGVTAILCNKFDRIDQIRELSIYVGFINLGKVAYPQPNMAYNDAGFKKKHILLAIYAVLYFFRFC
jgi:hypothetical protein